MARLLSAISGALTLDQNTHIQDLENLGLRLKGVDPSKVIFETLPQRGLESTDTNLGDVFTDSSGALELIPKGQTASVGSVQVLDQAGFNAMIAKLKDQAPPAVKPTKAAKAPAAPKLTVAPSKVLVTVQNGVGRSGLAGEISRALAANGFQTGAPESAPNINYAVSEVHYAPGNEAAAQTVAAAIPGAVLKEDPTVSNGIVLIAGANYSSVQPVQVSATGAITPTQVTTTAPAAAATPAVTGDTAASAGNACTY